MREELPRNGSYFPGRGTLVEKTFLDGEAVGLVRGRVSTLAECVLRVLARRGVAVSEGMYERIAACRDIDRLERWFDKAFSVEAAEELLAFK